MSLSSAHQERFRQVFAQFDSNRDGAVTRPELARIFEKMLDRRPSEDELSNAMRLLDSGARGVVAYSHFMKVLEQTLKENRRRKQSSGAGPSSQQSQQSAYGDSKRPSSSAAPYSSPYSSTYGGGSTDSYADEKEDDFEEEGDDSDLEEFATYTREVKPGMIDNADAIDGDDFGIRVDSAAPAFQERFLAVKPWKGAIHAPTNAPKNNPNVPSQRLELEWAYGYRCHDSRDNIAIDSTGHLIYPTAAIVVKYDAETHSQTHFQGHNDDVICLAQCPSDPDLIASGQVATIVDKKATHPHICVWNSKTGESVKIEQAHKRAVRAVAFSPNGRFLASVGFDNNCTLTVWDWRQRAAIASLSADTLPSKIFNIRWSSDNAFVTVGVKHVFFWSFDGKKLTKSRGTCKGEFKMGTFFSVAPLKNGTVAVATREGPVYIFNGGKASRKVAGHTGACHTVCSFDGGFISGGKDGKVIVYGDDLKERRTIQMPSPIRCVVTSGSRLVMGTQSGQMCEMKDFMHDEGPILLHQGHSDGELWGLDVDPNNHEYFATAGEDNKLMIWETKTRRNLMVVTINDKPGKKHKKGERAASTTTEPPTRCARGVAFHPKVPHIAVGTNAGEVSVYDLERNGQRIACHDLNQFGRAQVTNKTGNWIQALKYSPDGRVLAVATHGSVIVLCDTNRGYTPGAALKTHNSAVTHLDWSADSTFIQSNCRSYDLLFHTIEAKLKDSKHNPHSSQLKDTKWATQTCILGWPVQGVFDPTQDGTDVNAVDRSPDEKLLATGDDYGAVNLYRYPVVKHNKHHIYPGHSSHVMGCRFLLNNTRLITIGGGDKTILQWRVAA